MNKPLLADRVFATRRAAIRATAASDLPALLASARTAADAKSLDADALALAGDALHSWRDSNANHRAANAALSAAIAACEARDGGLDVKAHEKAIRAAVRATCDLADIAASAGR